MTEHTTAKLARALAEIPGMPKWMITKAVDGFYHDYLSPLAMPELQLVADLRSMARHPSTKKDARPLLKDLAQRVIDGEFDATKAESDEWAASPEGQATFRELMGGA